jgi:hypothetical protein
MPAGEGYRELLLAKVLVGEVADLGRKTDRTLKFPPEREPGLRCACGSALCARAGGSVGRRSPSSTALAQAFVACRYDTVKGVTTAHCQACLATAHRAGIRAARVCLAGMPWPPMGHPGMPAALVAKGPPWPPPWPPWPPEVMASVAKAQAAAITAAGGAPQAGGSRVFFDPSEHLLTSFHTSLIVEFGGHLPTLSLF